jgi:hypothetical protein
LLTLARIASGSEGQTCHEFRLGVAPQLPVRYQLQLWGAFSLMPVAGLVELETTAAAPCHKQLCHKQLSYWPYRAENENDSHQYRY